MEPRIPLLHKNQKNKPDTNKTIGWFAMSAIMIVALIVVSILHNGHHISGNLSIQGVFGSVDSPLAQYHAEDRWYQIKNNILLHDNFDNAKTETSCQISDSPSNEIHSIENMQKYMNIRYRIDETENPVTHELLIVKIHNSFISALAGNPNGDGSEMPTIYFHSMALCQDISIKENTQFQDKENEKAAHDKSIDGRYGDSSDSLPSPADRSNPAQSSSGGSPNGTLTDSLSTQQRGAIGAKVRECWPKGAGALNIDQQQVMLMVTVDPTGTARMAVVAPEDQGKMGDPRFRAFAERAVRAVLDARCAQMPIPPGLVQGPSGTLKFRFRP